MSEHITRVLCVDDEPRVLEGLERNLGWQYEVHTAGGGVEALRRLDDDGPFAVVISDMRMPGMNGATFLALARERAPDTSRILLTGYSDLEAAVAAVNQGHIFRFLNKPCGPDVLLPTVAAAVEQNRLVCAEQQLLENTLSGAIQVLVDVLSLSSPVAFNRAGCVKRYVQHITEKLHSPEAWQYDLAAMLCQIGCITLPSDTLDKAYAGQPLSALEEEMLLSHPSVGQTLLARVPRLELVAQMVGRQRGEPIGDVQAQPTDPKEQVLLGAALLRLALDVDRAVVDGESVRRVVATLGRQRDGHSPLLLDALKDFRAGAVQEVVRAVRVRDLQSFMVLDEDVRSIGGTVVVRKGRQVDGLLITRLKNFMDGVGLVEPIRVRVVAAF